MMVLSTIDTCGIFLVFRCCILTLLLKIPWNVVEKGKLVFGDWSELTIMYIFN